MQSAEEVIEKVPPVWGHSCQPCSPRGWGSLLQGAASHTSNQGSAPLSFFSRRKVTPAQTTQEPEARLRQAQQPQNPCHTLSLCYRQGWESLRDTLWFGVCDGSFPASEHHSSPLHAQGLGSTAPSPSEPQILLPACGSWEL